MNENTPKMVTVISRPLHGISLNTEREYLRDKDKLLTFANRKRAKEFLRSKGFSEAIIEDFDYPRIPEDSIGREER